MIITINGRVAAGRAELASGFLERMTGLIGKKNIEHGSALIIKDCRAIHTFFMRFPIDAVFINKNNEVVKIKAGLKPWRVCVSIKASGVIEFPAGAAAANNITVGSAAVLNSGN